MIQSKKVMALIVQRLAGRYLRQAIDREDLEARREVIREEVRILNRLPASYMP